MMLENGGGRLVDPPVQIEESACTGCGACVTACPVDVLTLDIGTGKAIVAHLADCCACFLCRDDCPSNAIVINHDSGNPRLISIYDQLEIELKAFSK